MATEEGRCGVIVTGASRGIGKSIALQLTKGEHSLSQADFCLVSRSEGPLNSLKEEIQKEKKSEVFVIPTDLSDPSVDYSAHLSSFLELVESKKYHTLYLFNNSGSVDPICPSDELHTKKKEVQNALNLNVESVISLTSAVVSSAKKGEVKKLVIVNITSLAAVAPFENWAVYCAGKAAREMFHQVLATELGERARILNYAPGVVNTKIIEQVISEKSPMSATAGELVAKGGAFEPDETVKAMFDYMKKDEYKSGSRIDAYDLCPDKMPKTY